MQRDANAWSGGWWDATGFANYYTAVRPSYHTGADLNSGNGADLGQPVFASADGVVVFAGAVKDWQGEMIVIAHKDGVWTRYAHMQNLRVAKGQRVDRGQQIGEIGDYKPVGAAADHLHFDVAKIDLGVTPGDWPGLDLARLKRDYVDPKAWINSHRDNIPDAKPGRYVVTSSSGVRVRAEANATADHLFTLPYKSEIVVDEIIGDAWAKARVMLGGAGVNYPRTITPVFAYVALSTLESLDAKPAPAPVPTPTPTPTPTPSTSAMRLGLHLLNPMSDKSGRIGDHAFDLGCRVFTVMDDEQYAISLCNRGARVFFRWWTGNNPIKPSDLAGRVAGFCQTPGMVILGLNEGDNYGCNTASEMRFRGDWDAEAFRLIKAQGGRYAGFGCAVGNPEFLDQAVVDTVRKWYAPLWAQGMLFNYHAYSPQVSKQFSEADYPWYEGRWRFLFERCGFDPKNPGKAEIISDECGLDIGGQGGFSSVGAGDDVVRAWCVKHYEDQSRPVVVNGVSYPSPYTDGTLFQSSESQRWAGYNVRPEAVKWSK